MELAGIVYGRAGWPGSAVGGRARRELVGQRLQVLVLGPQPVHLGEQGAPIDLSSSEVGIREDHASMALPDVVNVEVCCRHSCCSFGPAPCIPLSVCHPILADRERQN